MMINFGSMGKIGGKTVMSGTASGLDTQALIEELSEAKKIPIKEIEDKIDNNSKIISAYHDFQNQLRKFQNIANTLRNIPSIDASDNAFDIREVSLSSNTSLPASNYIEVAAGNKADLINSEITINQLATQHIEQSIAFSSNIDSVVTSVGNPEAGKFIEGTFQINDIDITLREGDSLIEINDTINAVSHKTGVKSSIVKVAEAEFRIVLQSIKTGIGNKYNIIDEDGIMDNAGFFVVQNAQNAEFSINNIVMTRESNLINDVLNNITISLKQVTDPGIKINLNISENKEIAKAYIVQFVNEYNDLMLFASRQQEREAIWTKNDMMSFGSKYQTMQYKEGAILRNDILLKNTMDSILREVTSYVRGIDDGPITLGDIGISLVDFEGDSENPKTKNILRIDDTILNDALNHNFEAVRKIFEFDFNASSKSVLCTGRGNQFSVNQFSLEIDTSLPEEQIKLHYLDGDEEKTIIGYYSGSETSGNITFPKNTVAESLSFIYAGTGQETVDINITQGIADRLYNYINEVVKSEGEIDRSIALINDNNNRFHTEIMRKNEDLDDYIEKLRIRFSKMEHAISNYNSVLLLLDAQNKAMDNK